MTTLLEAIRRLLAGEASVTINFIAAALALLVTMGIQIDNEQIEAIKDFVATLMVFAGAAAGIRQSVWSQDTVRSPGSGREFLP